MTERKIVALADIYPEMKEILDSGGEFSFISTGVSMTPMLGNRTHTVYLKKPVLPLKKNDIPLVKRDDGSFVLHRVVGRDKNGYILCGDHQAAYEHGIKDENVVGVLSRYRCPDGRIITVDDREYKRYVRKMSVISPLRYVYHKIRVFLHLSPRDN